MLRLDSYDIVFQEVPGEVALALNISGCPYRCPGCHSPHLRENTGAVLDSALISGLLERYGDSVTCVCFMGGDGEPEEVERLSGFVRAATGGKLKTGWYSGGDVLPDGFDAALFDFIKLGSYDERLGGLGSPSSNQRFYRIEGGAMIDETARFRLPEHGVA